MLTQRQLFFRHVGQTSDEPVAIEAVKAEGIYIYDNKGNKYIDLIAGVSVSNVGHRHPKVVEAVKNQLDKYMHLMVYGEYIQSPQVEFAKMLTDLLPKTLDSIYYVNSGSEAIEGALKLAKRYTGRHKIIAFKNTYHGSTHGALSLMSDDTYNMAFRPLLPAVEFLDFNSTDNFDIIDKNTACVVVEAVQAEAGIIPGKKDFFEKLSRKCKENGVLIISDEVQTGFGRTGSLFAFEQFGFVPDIMAVAKGMGAGMPVGAFISDKKIMDCFTNNPILGHITTFGGHPVSVAAALAGLKVLTEGNLISKVKEKGELFLSLLKHQNIKSVRGIGLFYAVDLGSFDNVKKFIENAENNGILTDWFLFDETCFRIAPPLTITQDEIKITCEKIIKSLDF